MSAQAPDEPVVLNGRYEIHSRIARGGMAEVFLARDQLLVSTQAVTVSPAERQDPPIDVHSLRLEGAHHAFIAGGLVVGE